MPNMLWFLVAAWAFRDKTPKPKRPEPELDFSDPKAIVALVLAGLAVVAVIISLFA